MSKHSVPPWKLCYINGSFAYFTTQPLDKQWGDDWNDAPYEHNAGEPYEYIENDRERGREPWEIVKVAFDAPLETPGCSGHPNSSYSVEDINSGHAPWLRDVYGDSKVAIPAGVDIPTFCQLIRKAGGLPYFAATIGHPARLGEDET